MTFTNGYSKLHTFENSRTLYGFCRFCGLRQALHPLIALTPNAAAIVTEWDKQRIKLALNAAYGRPPYSIMPESKHRAPQRLTSYDIAHGALAVILGVILGAVILAPIVSGLWSR